MQIKGATQILGQAEATQLLGHTPFWASDIRAPSLPEERCPSHLGGLCRSTWGSHLVSQIPQRLVCTGESVDYKSYTATGIGRSNTISGADPTSGARHPGTFSARGEMSIWPRRAFPEHLGGGPFWSWISMRLVCTGESADYRGYTASGTGTDSGLQLLPGGRSQCQICAPSLQE